MLGDDAVTETHQSMGSEDFAWYLEHVPGAMLRLGCGAGRREVDLHSATFDLDERAIEIGILTGAAALVELMEAAAG
jgi:amidohydrolase